MPDLSKIIRKHWIEILLNLAIIVLIIILLSIVF